MRTVYFLFVQEITRILAQLSIWFFEHCGEISCSLLVNPSHNDASQEGRNTCLWEYALNLFTEHSGEHWWEQNIFCSFTAPQAFWQSSALGALSTLGKSVVLYSLTAGTLMSSGKDETRVCGYTLWIYSMSTLENTDQKRIFFACSAHHQQFGKAQHLVLRALSWHQLFSTH